LHGRFSRQTFNLRLLVGHSARGIVVKNAALGLVVGGPGGSLDDGSHSSSRKDARLSARRDLRRLATRLPGPNKQAIRRAAIRSLLDCFATKHAADCDICVREAIFAQQEHKLGKSAEQIRTEIMDGGGSQFQVTN